MYSNSNDIYQVNNIIGEDKELANNMRQKLLRLVEKMKLGATDSLPTKDQEVIDELKQLGYIQ